MNGFIIPIVAIVFGCSIKLVSEIKDYLLKKEQIKADTELKAEALRLKNSLELEKFINNEAINEQSNQNRQSNPNHQNIKDDLDNDSFDRIRRKTNNI